MTRLSNYVHNYIEVIEMVVKTRKQGNSLMITVPASFKVGENAEYKPTIDENGVISVSYTH